MGGIETITLSTGDGLAASFAPEAGMVCRSLRHEGEELLDQGHGLGAYAERGATMGIPLLHPWANRLARFNYTIAGHHVDLPAGPPLLALDDNGLPIHGVIAGQLPWQVTNQETERLAAGLEWNQPQLLGVFPFPHRLEWEASMTPGALAIATTLRATGDVAVPASFGYHPYIALPGAPRQSWRVELPVTRRLLLDDRMIPTGATEPVSYQPFVLGTTSWDDGFDGLERPGRFVVTGGGRRVSVELSDGYPYAQVYAPPDKAFICFEPMTAPANALISGDGLAQVPPGESLRAEFVITVARDPGTR